MIRERLDALLDELKRRRLEGENEIFISDDAYDRLITLVENNPGVLSDQAEMKQSAKKSPFRKKTDLPTIPVGQPKKKKAKASEKNEDHIPKPPEFELTGESKDEQWNNLRELVLNDSFCNSQVKKDKQVVFGVGNVDARIFFCGEAPGAEEEVQGEPFVGPAGQLLTKIISAMGLSREEVYIGNIMNFRPPMDTPYGNRPPTVKEMQYCLPYLKAQVDIVQPDVIIALGKTAVNGLLGNDPKRTMSKARGNWFTFESIPLLPTFHPSYLLRNNSNRTKRNVWEDMLLVMEKLNLPISQKQRDFFQN